MRRLIYPAARALEQAAALPGIRPLRMFAVLWPLWQAETTAHVYEEQQYEVIDRFVVRAVGEAGIASRAELLRFFALPNALVERCLRFLQLIGHLTLTADAVALTALGARSAQDGIRYVPKESRQQILVERLTGTPLPRRYYDGGTPVLSTPIVEEGQLADRTRFLRLYPPMPFRQEIVTQLEHHPDRAGFNLPSQLRDLRVLTVSDSFLPVYLIETADHGLLAYTNLSEQRDTFLESICRQVAVADLIEADGVPDPKSVWTSWLARSGMAGAVLRQNRNGVWRVALAPSMFGEQGRWPLTKVGSYQFADQHFFLQLWCDDDAVRSSALRERALRIATMFEVESRSELLRRVGELSSMLEVGAPDFEELRDHARRGGDSRRLAHLDGLTP